jgi:hypothetical protein
MMASNLQLRLIQAGATNSHDLDPIEEIKFKLLVNLKWTNKSF